MDDASVANERRKNTEKTIQIKANRNFTVLKNPALEKKSPMLTIDPNLDSDSEKSTRKKKADYSMVANE